MKKLEQRYRNINLEVRAAVDATKMPKIRMMAVPFNEVCQDPVWGEFYEVLDPSAFDKCLADSQCDVRVKTFHQWDQIPLARYRKSKSENTLSLMPEARGLFAEFEPADTTIGRDVVTSMSRGDIEGVSIGFYCLTDDWSAMHNGLPLRRIKEAWLDEISIIDQQHYQTAEAQLRSKQSESSIMTPDDYKELVKEVRSRQAPYMVPISILELELQLASIDD